MDFSSPPLKLRATKFAARVMFIFFMKSRGMLLIHAVPSSHTMNATYSYKVNIIRYYDSYNYYYYYIKLIPCLIALIVMNAKNFVSDF